MSNTPESNPGAMVVSNPKALAIANRQLHIGGRALARIGQERYIEFFATHPDASRWFVPTVSACFPCRELMIERYADRWDWESLSHNEALPWSEALIERYADRWDWWAFGYNEALPWSEAFIERYADRWDWEKLSSNKSLPWSEALIERYADRWDWARLSSNEALPWTEAFFERYADRWDWESLSYNEALPWSEALIERYADRWDWEAVPSSALSKILLRWPEASIRGVMDRIVSRKGRSTAEHLALSKRGKELLERARARTAARLSNSPDKLK